MILGGLAQALFFFPFILLRLIPIFDGGGVYFLLFWPLSLLLAICAMVQSAVASRRGLWWCPDGGKRFVCVFFGLPVFLLVMSVGLLMKR